MINVTVSMLLPQNTSRLTKFVVHDTLVIHKRNEMKRGLLPVALACLLAVLPAGCGTDAEFPPHKNSYALGFLTGDVGIVYVRQMDNIDLSKYPHLRLRQGFTLKRAVERLMGGDTIGYVTAIDSPTGRGFAVEDMDGVQGGFLFAPLKSAEEALEYTQFMFHEPSSLTMAGSTLISIAGRI